MSALQEADPQTPQADHRLPLPALLLGVPLAFAAIIGFVLVAFALPGVKAAPHDVPIGVTGPTSVVTTVSTALDQRQPGGFAVTGYPDADALQAAIRDREVYGGFAPTPQGTTVFVASGAGPVVAQTLTQIGTALAGTTGGTATVQDIAPLTQDDPRGAGLGAAMLPMVMGSILPAIALSRLTRRRGLQVAATLIYSVIAGFAFAAILHFGFGSIDGSYLRESLALTAAVGAGALALLGLQAAFGMVGFGLGAAVLMLLGNPLSGASSAPHFLAVPWRQIGQAMPPGAGSQLLRSAAYFDGAGPMTPWWVLGVTALVGLALVSVSSRRAG